jgi:hypothetical protein
MSKHEMTVRLEHPPHRVLEAMERAGAEAGLLVEPLTALCMLFVPRTNGESWPIRIRATVASSGRQVTVHVAGYVDEVDPLQEAMLKKKMTELVAATTIAVRDAAGTAPVAETAGPVPDPIASVRAEITPDRRDSASLPVADVLKPEDLEHLRRRLSDAGAASGDQPRASRGAQVPAEVEAALAPATAGPLDPVSLGRELKERFDTFDATFTRAFRELANGVSAVHETELPEMRTGQAIAVLDRFAPDLCRLADGATMSLAASLGSLIRKNTRRPDVRALTERRIVDALLGDALSEFEALHSELARDLSTLQGSWAPERERIRQEILKLLGKLPEMRQQVIDQTFSMIGGDAVGAERTSRFTQRLVADARRLVNEWRAGLENVDQYIANTVPPSHPSSALGWFFIAVPGTVAAGLLLHLALSLVGSLAEGAGLQPVAAWAAWGAQLLEVAPFKAVLIIAGVIAAAVFRVRLKRWRAYLELEPYHATVVESVRNSFAGPAPAAALATSDAGS